MKIYQVTVEEGHNLDCPGEEDHWTGNKLFSTLDKAKHYLLNDVKHDFEQELKESEIDSKVIVSDDQKKIESEHDYSQSMHFVAYIEEKDVD